ncbi:MAG: 6-phosphofructokinase [Ruminococcaceae bacterium]|nr:6-phosphofructokinase [Oscillospiraceae bacterium]
MKKLKNALIGQSGGPTAVINASLAGAITEYLSNENCSTLYGAVNGIKGVLREEFLNLNEVFSDKSKIDLLMQTPSSYLGSCRYRLSKENDDEIEKIVSILQKNDIGYFFYIGGNDSMDTVMRLSKICHSNGIKAIGIPKTIDNDLVGTDHCPGYGSSAKYIATAISEMALDAGCYDIKNVLIVEIMGRNAGWLAASSALARTTSSTAPDLIYLPEKVFDDEKFLYDIRQKLLHQDTVVVAVSEGIKYSNGNYVAQSTSESKKDMFGHSQLGGVCKKLEHLVKNRLGIKVRGVELNLPQRCASHNASDTDINEAFKCGEFAVKCALEGESGKMIAMNRADGSEYDISYSALDISNIANSEKIVPDSFINADRNDVTDEFIKYALPLIQGERNIIFENGIPAYIKR